VKRALVWLVVGVVAIAAHQVLGSYVIQHDFLIALLARRPEPAAAVAALFMLRLLIGVVLPMAAARQVVRVILQRLATSRSSRLGRR
jgi:hypothetical protein